MRQKREPQDYACALERCVNHMANPRIIRRTGGKFYANAWWRDGKKASVLFDFQNGSWYDFKTEEHGGVRALAERLGTSLADFMERWGPTQPIPPRPKLPPEPEPEGIAELWERLVAFMPRDRIDGAARWLHKVRGFPENVALVLDSGFVTLSASTVPLWGEWQGLVARRLREHGPQIVVPMRDAWSGQVCNLHFRPLGLGPAKGGDNTTTPSRSFLPRARLISEDGHPRAYGFPRITRQTTLAVVVEGAVDQMATELFLRADARIAVIGAASSSTMHHWTAVLKKNWTARVVVVPHLDKLPEEAGQWAAIRMFAELEAAGVPCRFFDWTRAHAHCPEATDIGDLVKLLGFERAQTAFLEGLA